MVWWQVGRDPDKGTIIPLFEPPKGFSPAAIRFLMRMSFDAKTFAAAVMDLAVKGYLRIREANGLFVLEKKGAGQLFSEEQNLGRDLFDGNQILEISQKHQGIISSSQGTLKKSLQKMLDNIYFKTNRRYFWPALIITLLMLGALIITADDVAAAAASLLFYVVAWCHVRCVLLSVARRQLVLKDIFPGFRVLLDFFLGYCRSGRSIFFDIRVFRPGEHSNPASSFSLSSQSPDAPGPASNGSNRGF